MKKQKGRPQAKSKKAKSPAPETAPEAENTSSRRAFMRNLQLFGIGAVAVGGITYWVVSDVGAAVGEMDLDKIGNGIPTIVQIHDPNCSLCASLMRETRTALEAFGDDELQYLVANIRHDEGAALARQHGVQHVTLLLLDGDGNRKSVLTGTNTADRLEAAFRRHIADSSS